ncbi:DUF1016 N-terminal domain-containing protein [Thomasclavelia cocleata]|uniref:DUF1016 N-terminal domain-containing protein n=1 Tax=Thomasclavelia cocleata TaxID=69824 RepID=UPI002431FC33|nr:DUF1016 N-terminal domain-containing protein [Thomasclavelia cocleata]
MRIIIYISDDDKRSFYEKEAINANWSVRELKRQIGTSLFERLLLSNGETNKKKVLGLALKGSEIAQPEDIVKDPYVFEFLGLSENRPMMDLIWKKLLLDKLKSFFWNLEKDLCL